jgi:cysteine-rich repeat protein
VIAGAEQCEGADLGGQTCQTQSFDFGTLGCNSGCDFDVAGCIDVTNEVEPNDDGSVAVATVDFLAANANGPFSTDTLISGSISPVGDDDFFAITNPGPGWVVVELETYGPGGPGTCDVGIDTFIDLRTSTNIVLGSNDDNGVNDCSWMVDITLPPGSTVYARVIDFGDNNPLASYLLDIRFSPVVCGDGVGGPAEQCDDGGNVGGDGCSATCVLEGATQEIEPNASGAQADATGIVITGDTRIAGAIGLPGDLDRFRINLAAPQYVRFETFSTLGVCTPSVTTTLRLFNAAGAAIITDTGPLQGSGIRLCAALVFPLPAGVSYVQVERTGNLAPLPTYVLEVEVLGDAGAESEANDNLGIADPNLGGGTTNVYVFADHTMQVDSDYYAIDVPENGSIRLEIIEGDRAIETCESLGVDSRLTLYDAAGAELVDDDDDGRGYCSEIDGTGAGLTPQDLAAHDLPAGTYYAQVRASTSSQMNAAGQFTYRLVATVRQP